MILIPRQKQMHLINRMTLMWPRAHTASMLHYNIGLVYHGDILVHIKLVTYISCQNTPSPKSVLFF